MAQRITPFLMFEGNGQQAMDFYLSLFPDSRLEEIEHFGPEAAGAEGKVSRAVLVLNGQRLMVFDSPVHHDFTFTPSISLFVDCASEAEIDRLFAAFSENGKVMMDLAEYPFARKFAWVADRFGVSWQLSLTAG